jgi:transcription elongation factor Elf1
MPRSWRGYASTEREAKAFRRALRILLICPHCGTTDQCVDSIRSHSSVVMRCGACRLRFHVRRADLAASVRQRADAEQDAAKARTLERLALVVAPTMERADWLTRGVPDESVDA